jgi:DNA-binding HxlR family transcriptional regulator
MKLKKITKREKPPLCDRWYDDACGTALALEFLGERWSLLIIRELLLGSRRFVELRAGLPGVSANVLTRRLEGLMTAGILIRRKLPPPASVHVYELTNWGYEAEPIIMNMGRWALRSPAHDPSLPVSRVALMLSLKGTLVPERICGFVATIGFQLEDESYTVVVADGKLMIERGQTRKTDAILTGEAQAFLPVLYGKRPLAASALTVQGDLGMVDRFIKLFDLPEKLPSPW